MAGHLSAAAAAAGFVLTGTGTRFYVARLGYTVDLATISAAEAEDLVQHGFGGLQRQTGAPAKKKRAAKQVARKKTAGSGGM